MLITNEGPQIFKTLSTFCIFRTFSELILSGLYSFTSIWRTRTVLDFQLVSYFTNFAIQNVNKAFIYVLIYGLDFNFKEVCIREKFVF